MISESELMDKLAELPWTEMTHSGQTLRKSIFITMGDCICNYEYGGGIHLPHPCPKWLYMLTDFISELVDLPKGFLNCVNGNCYNSGQQGLGPHADDEKLFNTEDKRRIIVSLSIGATRTFVVRRNEDSKKWEVPLSSFDVAVMDGFFQNYYTHAIKKDLSTGVRYNLTWRHIQKHLTNCPLSN